METNLWNNDTPTIASPPRNRSESGFTLLEMVVAMVVMLVGAATLNDGGYLGNQVPASIVADAFFPLSRTWSDSMSAYNPEGGNAGSTMRTADVNVPDTTQETSVRAVIIAGDNLSALTGSPDAGNGADSRLSGGMHNFPRFLENWLTPQRRWNFVGSFCPLYHSTQALGPWTYIAQEVYGAPSPVTPNLSTPRSEPRSEKTPTSFSSARCAT
jgi:prepilin-type N-terminal cleavage/methylation domain-containing protein